MKKLALIALLATAAWSIDFSQMSTEELMNMRGTLSAADRPAFKAEMQKRMQAMSPSERQQMMQRKGMKKGMGKGSSKGMQNRPTYESFDTDGDGKVTEKEFYDVQAAKMTQKANEGKMMKNAANAPTFESIDTNHDKVMSSEEFSTFQSKRMNNKMKGM
jgi:Ca2+-binding EF-hand superfamily protein